MMNEEALSELLSHLDAVANSPLTAYHRELRAQGLLAEAGVSVAHIVKAMHKYSLPWNQKKAEECGLPVDTWLEAARIVNQSPGESLCDLLDRIHQMEAVAAMLRAGYVSGRDAHGRLVWSR
jgi:hypothetical protein